MGHPENQSIGLLAALEALILQSFRRCQKLGVECLRADRLADGRHIVCGAPLPHLQLSA